MLSTLIFTFTKPLRFGKGGLGYTSVRGFLRHRPTTVRAGSHSQGRLSDPSAVARAVARAVVRVSRATAGKSLAIALA